VTGQAAAFKMLESKKYDLLLLDISLSDGNGYAVCSAAKKESNIPVIFLSASGDEFSVVTGLDLGADDYISKPFRPRELVSRINSVLRRSGKNQQVVEIGGIRVDTVKAQVTRDGQEIFLSALEYRLLLVFLNNRGAVLTRAKLLEEIWDMAGEFVNDNTLTVYIKRLRDKIEPDPQSPTIIKTVRGLGYKLGD
jgi:DNA-binding response OmpR family regulator